MSSFCCFLLLQIRKTRNIRSFKTLFNSCLYKFKFLVILLQHVDYDCSSIATYIFWIMDVLEGFFVGFFAMQYNESHVFSVLDFTLYQPNDLAAFANHKVPSNDHLPM